MARLSLLAILEKVAGRLRANVAKFPGATVTVALPLATIQKQLGAGSVKMSLASLYRQAPAGTFKQPRIEEKRMVEVPLAEVLRHVRAASVPPPRATSGASNCRAAAAAFRRSGTIPTPSPRSTRWTRTR